MNTSKCIYVNYTRFNETHSYFTIYERRRLWVLKIFSKKMKMENNQTTISSDNSDKITDGYLTYTYNGDMVISYTDCKIYIFLVLSEINMI